MRRKTGHVDLFPIGYKQCAIVFDKVLTFQQLSKTGGGQGLKIVN